MILASRLGAFLRAMADPEGRGLPVETEREIAAIEARVAAAVARGPADA